MPIGYNIKIRPIGRIFVCMKTRYLVNNTIEYHTLEEILCTINKNLSPALPAQSQHVRIMVTAMSVTQRTSRSALNTLKVKPKHSAPRLKIKRTNKQRPCYTWAF